MADEALQHAQPRAVFADHRRRLVGQDLLVAVGLQELADPEPAGVAPGLLGRQRVVGADHLVAIGDVGAGPEEQRAVAGHVLEEPVVAVGHHLHMLGGDVVGDGQHLVVAVAEDHLAVVAQDRRGFGGGQDPSSRSISAMVSSASLRELVIRHGGRVVAVLGLAQQVGRAQLGIDGVVGDHQVSVGPAKRSMPTRPKSCRLASATKALPGPTSMCTGSIVSVPSAIAPTAWMPPST
jgi:hypothetical protein